MHARSRTAGPVPAPAPAIPAFALYGEAGGQEHDLLHIEELRSRSRLYRWEIDAHLHRGLYQVVWIEAGDTEVLLDERRERAAGPAVVLIPPGVVHGFRFTPDIPGLVLTLGGRFLFDADGAPADVALRALFDTPGIECIDADDEADAAAAGRIKSLFDALARQAQAPDAAQAPVCALIARAALWRIARERASRRLADAHAPGARGHALFTRFRLLLESHFLEHWPVSRYADRIGVSVSRLNRLCRAAAGRTALELAHERLTREACRRLVYVAAPVSSIAHELGFDDPAYFCRFFRRRVGTSPREFRAQQGH